MLKTYGFPKSFLFRKKQGFAIPARDWFLEGGQANAMLRDLLTSQRYELDEYIDVKQVEAMLNAHSMKRDFSSKLRVFLAFAIWMNK